jgi:hypothetical protein
MRGARPGWSHWGPQHRLAAAGTLAIALCATGCFSDRGVAIEVDIGKTGATSVELFLGTKNCADDDSTKFACAGIGPPPRMSPLLPGDVWFRDALMPYTAEVKGQTATFQLRADTPSTVPIVIAVGLANGIGVGTATLDKLDVSAHGARVVTTTLIKASQVTAGQSPPEGEDRVQVWSNASSSCVVVEHGTSGKPDRTFVVPVDDPDCDDAPTPECDRNVWNAERLPGASSTPDCFVRSAPACVLGSRGCRDGDPQSNTSCAAQHEKTCVPDVFCDISSCGRFDEACLRSLIMNDAIPRVTCDVPTQATSPLAPCPDNAVATIDLGVHFQTGQCEELPKIASVVLDGFGKSASFGGAMMDLEEPKPACQFDIDWKGGTRSALAPKDYGLIQVPSRQGALMIPIVLTFTPGTCGKPFQCQLEGNMNDALWSCAP